jgi:hypothetical protein
VVSQFGSGIYNFKTQVAFANENRMDLRRQRKKHHVPQISPFDFFLWGFIKDRVFVPPLPATLVDLRTRITAAITVIDDMLQRIWHEHDYRLDVCRVMGGAYIDHL